MNKLVNGASRDRVLSDEELALVRQQAGPGDFGACVRLLILTAARREEVGGLRWSEIDGETWRLPAERSKNHRAHELHLTPLARRIIGELPRLDSDRDLLFGSGVGGFSGWSKAKRLLDARMVAALRAKHGRKAKLEPWRLHDLRRTAATRMVDIGVQPFVVEAVLNHLSGHKAGVAGIYNRSLYLPEKRAALERWADHVEKIVGEVAP